MAQKVSNIALTLVLVMFTGIAGVIWLITRPWAKAWIVDIIGRGVDKAFFGNSKKRKKRGTKSYKDFSKKWNRRK